MRFLLVFIFLIVLNACATGDFREREFEEISIGMVKSEVLQTAGPPHWSDRNKGLDRWFYYMKPEDRQTERVVYFRKGRVVQKGERMKPLLTAEEVEELKDPPRKQQKPFKMKYTEDQLRQVIKKEIEKEEGKKTPPKFEEI
jgi:outer membrane protein assembly factor BamE (lipoprotein component of BamABCDE complex)